MDEEEIPYDELDVEIVNLCRRINDFPSLKTSDSCQGYVDGHREGEPWSVYFGPDGLITEESYLFIEFLVWLINGGEARAAGFDVYLGVNSPPPYLNSPGEALYWFIEGKNKHPDDLASFIQKMVDMVFSDDDGSDPVPYKTREVTRERPYR